MNTIQSIADQINAFSEQFQIQPESVEVTSYEQMGPNVRVFYKHNRTIGKTPEQIAKMTQKIRLLNELIVDPFNGEEEEELPEPEVPVKPVTDFSVTLADKVTVGESITAVVNILPADADDKTFTVTATPNNMVTILNGGTLITGVKAGNVALTYKSNSGAVADVIKNILVEAADVLPTSITLAVTGPYVVGDTLTETVTVTPSNTTNKEVTLISSNPAVVAVENNKFVVKSEGTANLTARSVAKTTVVSNAVVVNAVAE